MYFGLSQYGTRPVYVRTRCARTRAESETEQRTPVHELQHAGSYRQVLKLVYDTTD